MTALDDFNFVILEGYGPGSFDDIENFVLFWMLVDNGGLSWLATDEFGND